jgi:hypothetical protein
MRTRLVHQTGRALLVLAVVVAFVADPARAFAADATVPLATAASYAVLGGSTVTNTGPSTISGDVGLSPGSAVVGFPPATVTNGAIHAADAAASQAQADAAIGYGDAGGRPASATVVDIGGQLLAPGVYAATSSLAITGTVTLDGHDDPGAVFIFQAGTTLTTAAGSSVVLVNGASACNVFWQVGSSATLGSGSVFRGTVLALQSITATTGAVIEGRLLARNGAVTLDTNQITAPLCASAVSTTTTSTTISTTTSPAVVVPATEASATGTDVAGPVAGSPTTSTTSAGGTSTATGRTTTTLPRTGSSPLLAMVAALLLLVGGALLWIGRPPLRHAFVRLSRQH